MGVGVIVLHGQGGTVSLNCKLWWAEGWGGQQIVQRKHHMPGLENIKKKILGALTGSLEIHNAWTYSIKLN